MRVVQIGNHGPPHSTETHLRRALEQIGHTVYPVQESATGYRRATQLATGRRADLVLWTWTYGLGPSTAYGEQRLMIDRLRKAGIPIVSYHLDRWHGLEREPMIETAPFFRTDLVCTADGGAPWESAGVVHEWFPPAVLGSECLPGTPRDEYRSPLAFVGSWRPGYHVEWQHRPDLIRFLRDRYGDRCSFWPRPGEHAVRGSDLRDLYASVDLVVGDSCLVPYSDGTPVSRYCSDRIPETLGRGGALLHPYVPGVVYGDGLSVVRRSLVGVARRRVGRVGRSDRQSPRGSRPPARGVRGGTRGHSPIPHVRTANGRVGGDPPHSRSPRRFRSAGDRMTAVEVLDSSRARDGSGPRSFVVRNGPVSVRLVEGRLVVGVGAIECVNDLALTLARSFALLVAEPS